MMRFAIDTPNKKAEIFKSTVKKFVKSRPQEWFALLGFRRCFYIIKREVDDNMREQRPLGLVVFLFSYQMGIRHIVFTISSKTSLNCNPLPFFLLFASF
jgi:hypothetical protein